MSSANIPSSENVTIGSLQTVMSTLQLSADELAQMLGVPSAEVINWLDGQSISAPMQQRIDEITELIATLEAMKPHDSIAEWSRTQLPGFNMQSPLDLIAQGSTASISNVLGAMQQGMHG